MEEEPRLFISHNQRNYDQGHAKNFEKIIRNLKEMRKTFYFTFLGTYITKLAKFCVTQNFRGIIDR